ncbi:tryptophan 2-monooxygenase oxidoreductase [Ralstonia solanacearum]|uniref:Tryptophan 2-monooxygenase oxidoreductase n=1 Tax=Ralstonia solanacearum TaxID=305 RepID=A0AAD0WEV6_RALSL|nr:tryptophan 2-monooxygenase oxidoreductase [Ralstonia solanacearum]AXV80254.1 tryptophan 2-monooxygenase oxidoreductase [Ralstonia solanacearum]AXW51399.1 tryptophan 2-monooxygenase oxidoreductase [Ralstonia solanacearum]CBJ49703.1 putative tryptophan 2-monooxygenase oxidoreductase protein [Ralstonia solanacearum PSI07]
MGITVMPGLTSMESDMETQQILTTIGQAKLNGRFYRHPDSALVSYPVAVDNALGMLPDRPYYIAIVGGGAAGIAALYELSRLAKQLTAGKINVTLYETDPDSFLARRDVGTEAVNVKGLKAGRVSAARVNRNDTVYEVGAMRFPEIAGLTWHYASVVYGDNAPIKEFPNPGKVPTEFMFGDRIDRYKGRKPEEWLDPESPARKVFIVVADGLVGAPNSQSPISLFPIGGRDPAKVTQLLKSETAAPGQLRTIQETDWPAFIAAHDGTTLEAAVRRIVTREIDKGTANSLPPIAGLDQAETINYYVELFGRFGFGTGGFKPLFNMSLVEMMRLILWDYSNEYTLPVEENVEFIAGLYRKALETGGARLKVDVRQDRVSDVCHAESSRRPFVVSYDRAGNISSPSYDYVILAAPQHQLALAVSRSGYSAKPANLVLGDSALGLGTVSFRDAVPPLLLSNTSSAPNARIVTALNQLHMVRSSKVFGTIETAKLNEAFVPRLDGKPIKAVVSDSGLAASYVVPSPTETGTPRYSSFLASYTWDDDSTRLQHNFGYYPQNPPTSDGTASAMFRTMINRAARNVLDPDPDRPTSAPSVWWFSRLLSMVREEDRFVFDWTTNGTAGGFKVDGTGDHHQSNLCFRYHTHALNPGLGNRFFLASDSYSHLGGWLEGAFMSAINAVAGLVVAANGGNAGALSDVARPVVTGLRPVAP